MQCRGFKRVKGTWAWGIWLCTQDDSRTNRPYYGCQGKSQTGGGCQFSHPKARVLFNYCFSFYYRE